VRLKALLFVTLITASACGTDEVDRRIGARCGDNAQCADQCLTPSGDHPGGFCTVSCMDDGDCGRDDAVCVDEAGGVCLFACRDDGDCAFLNGEGASGWTCQERDSAMGSLKVLVCRGD
jgi:hypothetical protein